MDSFLPDPTGEITIFVLRPMRRRVRHCHRHRHRRRLLTLDEVAAILEAVGVRFDGVLPEDRGSRDRTHVYLFDDVVVKINQQAGSLRIARERNALALLRDASALRVPEYIGDGDDWIVMSRLAR